MKTSLVPHPEMPPSAIASVTAEIARVEEAMLVIRFVALGDVRNLRIPEPVRYASRQEELWQTTCFEAFLRLPEGTSYLEFNFAPSTGWAAYRFGSYRRDRQDLAIPPPHFDVETLSNRLELVVAVDTSALPAFSDGNPWLVNLAAVIEEMSGEKSFWALAHPSGPPDFHHEDCFALELPAARPA